MIKLFVQANVNLGRLHTKKKKQPPKCCRGTNKMGLENAELVQIASVARKETGTAGMSALGLELRQMSQGTKIPARHSDCWDNISARIQTA